MAYTGRFSPRNPSKYIGDHNNIIYRSSWECRVMDWLDRNPHILSWGSEEVIIPYKSPVDGRWHRYFPDFIVKFREQNGTARTMILEIKPKHQTEAPQPQKRKTKKYISEVVTYGVNRAKWKYAEEFCKDRGWQFQVLTEDHLGF